MSCCIAVCSEEAPKPEDTTAATRSAAVGEGETVTTQSKTKKSAKEDHTVMTNIESLYFADTYLFQGLHKFTHSVVVCVKLLTAVFAGVSLHSTLVQSNTQLLHSGVIFSVVFVYFVIYDMYSLHIRTAVVHKKWWWR